MKSLPDRQRLTAGDWLGSFGSINRNSFDTSPVSGTTNVFDVPAIEMFMTESTLSGITSSAVSFPSGQALLTTAGMDGLKRTRKFRVSPGAIENAPVRPGVITVSVPALNSVSTHCRLSSAFAALMHFGTSVTRLIDEIATLNASHPLLSIVKV